MRKMITKIEQNKTEADNNSADSGISRILLITGIIVIFSGLLIMTAASVSTNRQNSISGGAIIFIGPFPIIIGLDLAFPWLILAGILLGIISLVTFIMLKRKAN